MFNRTLSSFAILALLVLAACQSTETVDVVDEPTPDPGGWRLASGKLPTKAEFAALAATCEDKGGAIDSCLANLGLKRTQ
jgi:hypothetical protein